MNYGKHLSTHVTPQSEPILGKTMIKNSAGGYVFEASIWDQLDRFLILGTEGGSYYAGERDLTMKAGANLFKCVQTDAKKTVERIVEISKAGRAPKNDPAIFALAVVAKCASDIEDRRFAFSKLSDVCRIGTHLFTFAEAVKSLGGWGRATASAFDFWYTQKSPDDLAYQLLKYKSRNGWSHRDILRKIRTKPVNPVMDGFFKYATTNDVGKLVPGPARDRLVAAQRALQLVYSSDVPELCNLIRQFKLPHECVPPEQKNQPKVWEELIPHMKPEALIRNLAKITNVFQLSDTHSMTRFIEAQLDTDKLIAAKLHPFKVLVAARTYGQGHGDKGKLTWTPSFRLLNLLDESFVPLFKTVEPTNKRYVLALDVSSSMTRGLIGGMTGISPRVAEAAMAMVTLATEKAVEVIGFTAGNGKNAFNMRGARGPVTRLDIRRSKSIVDVCAYIEKQPYGGTDCALPMLWAAHEKVEADMFIVYTDNETWAGNIHPTQALQQYRQASGIPAKLVVAGLVGNDCSMTDPNDPYAMNIVGCDTAVPQLIADFAKL